MSTLVEVFQYDYALRALLASAMVGIMCGVLGCFIVLRNMSLIGDALSHAILPGVVAGFLVAGYSVLAFFTGSVIAGLVAAVLITWIQRNVRTREDAAIGIVFTSMFAIGVMGISWLTRQEGVHLDLKDFLFGNILGISDQDLWLTGLVLVFTLLCVAVFYRYLFITTFESVVARTIGIPVGAIHYFLMLLLSFAVVASLQSVGVILVVAMLITPASTAYLLTHRLRTMVWLAGLLGLLSTTLGLLLAIFFETTPGPAMTVTATGLYLLAVLFAPQRGLVRAALRRWRKQNRILTEDALKQAVRLSEASSRLPRQALRERMSLSNWRLGRLLRQLERQGAICLQGPLLELTEQGTQEGYALVRAHRLWETYLVQKMGLELDQIHEDAERYEHILPSHLLDEVEQSLGNPRLDPHGSPIPEKYTGPFPSLASLRQDEAMLISQQQISHRVRAELWSLGVRPGSRVVLLEAGEEGVRVQVDAEERLISLSLAEKIRVEPCMPSST
ncbi:MAG: hypothetical protein D6722_03855 [Bacteroidetes bacterium]|nr:MAG: hypothetical protein D6722_03855 [Bacteroidota bacterium]